MEKQLSLFDEEKNKQTLDFIKNLHCDWIVRIQTDKNYYSKFRVWSNENLTEKMEWFKSVYKQKVLWYHAVKV